MEGIDDLEFSKLEFKLIEDEIDIQSIEEITNLDRSAISILKEEIKTINDLIRAVKQLDNKIKNT